MTEAKFKVRTAKHKTQPIYTEDDAFDDIKYFDDEQSANAYYLSIRDNNYFTDMSQKMDRGWQTKASSCYSYMA